MSRPSRDKVGHLSGKQEPLGRIEVFSRTLDGWARVVALSRRHEGFDARGTPFPASLVAEFRIPGLGRCRKAAARGSGLLRYNKLGSMTSSRSLNDTEILTLDDSSSEELGDNSEFESEDDPEAFVGGVEDLPENPVVKGLQCLGVQNRISEIVGSRFQTVGELETALEWLLTSQPVKSEETPKDTMAPPKCSPCGRWNQPQVRAKCLYEDIVFCESAGSDGIYTVGRTLTGNCMNREHRYCYDCLWRAVREEVMNNAIPRCCGSSDLKTHEIVGGCGGAGHKADCNCGACGHTLLTQIQLEEIMNGYFSNVQMPSDEERQVLGLEWGIAHDGTSRWRSSKLERLWLHHAIRQQGGIKCPNVDCEAMVFLPSAEYLCAVHCPTEACRFHVDPFCSRCFLPAHHDWASCDEIAGISEEWFRWCLEGRVAFMTQVAANNEAYRNQLEKYNKTRHHREQDMNIAQANYNNLKMDEEYKEKHCRMCPSCKRVIQRVDGCQDMVCGRNYHGGGEQKGCGRRFLFREAPPYKAAKVELKQVGNALVEPSRVVEIRHFHLNGEPWHCSVCNELIQGPLILCINCHSFAACIHCDSNHDLSRVRVARRDSGSFHPPGHVFRVHLESIGAHVQPLIDEDGAHGQSLIDEDEMLALLLAQWSD